MIPQNLGMTSLIKRARKFKYKPHYCEYEETIYGHPTVLTPAAVKIAVFFLFFFWNDITQTRMKETDVSKSPGPD